MEIGVRRIKTTMVTMVTGDIIIIRKNFVKNFNVLISSE